MDCERGTPRRPHRRQRRHPTTPLSSNNGVLKSTDDVTDQDGTFAPTKRRSHGPSKSSNRIVNPSINRSRSAVPTAPTRVPPSEFSTKRCTGQWSSTTQPRTSNTSAVLDGLIHRKIRILARKLFAVKSVRTVRVSNPTYANASEDIRVLCARQTWTNAQLQTGASRGVSTLSAVSPAPATTVSSYKMTDTLADSDWNWFPNCKRFCTAMKPWLNESPSWNRNW